MAVSGGISSLYPSDGVSAHGQLKNIDSAIRIVEHEIFIHIYNVISEMFTENEAEKFADFYSNSEYRLSTQFHKEYKKLLSQVSGEREQNLEELALLRTLKKDLWGDKIFWEGMITEIGKDNKENELFNKESPVGL